MNGATATLVASRHTYPKGSFEVLYTTLLVALAVLATYPLLFHASDHLGSLYDQLDSSWRIWASLYHLPHDPLNLFQAQVFYPYHDTLMFDELIFGEALLAAPVLLLTGNLFLSFNLVTLLTFVIAGWGAYLLAYHLTANRIAAAVAGILYSFSAYHFSHLGHIGLSNIGYLPLLLLAFDKLLRSGGRSVGWAVAFAALIAIQALSAQYHFFYVLIILGLYLLYALLRRETRPYFTRQFVVRLLAVALAGMIPALPFYLTFMKVQNMYRFRVSDEEVYMLSANLKSLFAAPSSAPWLHSLLHRFDGSHYAAYEVGIFPGFIPLLLALVGVIWWLGHRKIVGGFYVPFLLILGFASLILALGPYLQLNYSNVAGSRTNVPLPYLLLYRFVPGFNGLHGVARIAVLATLALSMLAAYGMAGILARFAKQPATNSDEALPPPARPLARYALGLLPILLVGFALFEQLALPRLLDAAPTPSAAYRWLAAASPGPVLENPLFIFRQGLTSAIMINHYQYFTSYHHHRIVNGPLSSLNPSGYAKLVADFPGQFPSSETIDMMRGLGVRYIVFHLDDMTSKQRNRLFRQRQQLATSLTWRAGFDTAGNPLTEAASQGRSSGDLVYEIMPTPNSVLKLNSMVSPGQRIYFSTTDKKMRNGYMGVAEYVLAQTGCAIYGYNTSNFGVDVLAPLADNKYDYIVLYKDEPTTAFPSATRVWGNSSITFYRLRELAAPYFMLMLEIAKSRRWRRLAGSSGAENSSSLLPGWRVKGRVRACISGWTSWLTTG